MRHIGRKKLLIFFLVILAVVLFWSSSFLQEYLKEASSFLENYGKIYPALSILIFVGLTTLSAMLMSFSSVWLVPVAVLLWSNNFTVVLLLFSWLLGATLSYLIGYFGGYPIVRRFVSEEKISKYQNLVNKKIGFGSILLFRFILPSEIPGYLLGIAKYNFGKYLIVTFFAELPYAIYSVYAFSSIVEQKEEMFILTALFWILAVWFLGYMYFKKFKKNISE